MKQQLCGGRLVKKILLFDSDNNYNINLQQPERET